MSSITPRSRLTEPADAFDGRFRGLGIPVVKRTLGYFQSQYSRELIRSSIFSILSTVKGERVCVPEFGSMLFKLLFEPNDAVTRGLVKQAVTSDVTRWEKRVRVTNVLTSSTDDHDIKVFVEFEIVNTATTDSIVINFSNRTFTATLSQQ